MTIWMQRRMSATICYKIWLIREGKVNTGRGIILNLCWRESETERERETETETDIQRESQRQRERETERDLFKLILFCIFSVIHGGSLSSIVTHLLEI